MDKILMENQEVEPIQVAIVPHPQNEFPPKSGSVAKVVWESAQILASQCAVTIFCRRNSDQKKFSYVKGVKIHRVKTTFDEKIVLRMVACLQRYLGLEKFYLFRSYLYFIFMVKTALAIRKQRSQIIHLHNYSQFVPILRFFNPHGKIILHMHCHWLVEMDFNLIDRRLQEVNLIISPSDSITEQTRRRFPAHASKCVTIANGVDTKFFTKTNNRSLQDIRNKLGLNNKKIVLFVGRITPEKGVHLLIAAMAIVKKVFPEAVLILIGPDFLTPVSARLKTDLIYQQFERLKKNYRDHLSDLISRHGLDVVRLGLTPQAELINFYSLADVVVLPSFEEAGPLPVLEAMSCQVPMVATEVDGIKDYLSPEAGFLVAPNDVAALAEKIITYLDNTRLCKKMGLAGREWVERKFTWDHTVENLMAAYAGLVRKPSVQEEVYELEKAA